MIYFIGIDPGLSGGVGVLDARGGIVLAEMMPVMEGPKRRMVDGHALRILLRGCTVIDTAHAVIERVNAMPKQGVASTFSFGQSQGIAIGVVCGLGIGYEFVLPQIWKKTYGLIGKPKNVSVGLVKRRWPGLHLKAKDDGIADALLIADWLRTHR